MKIHLEHNRTILDIEREPMPPERFNALCKLAGAVIGSAVLLALVHRLGVWGLGALVAVGAYKLIQSV